MVVGSASRDLTDEDPRGWRLGGAAAYVGLTLARLGLRPRVVLGVDPAAVTATELQWLRDAGADLHLHQLAEGPVFTNHEEAGGRVQTCETPGLPIPTSAVPVEWRTADAWCLVPVADEINDVWAELPRDGDFVAIGWQGFLRNLLRNGVVTRRPPSASALLRRADVVCLSRDDVDDASPGHLLPLLGTPVLLTITAGSEGGTAAHVDAAGRARMRRYPAIEVDAVRDATGSGDAFLAGLVATRLGHPLGGSGRRGSDLRLAAALGSLVVEGLGLGGVPTMAAAAERMRRSLTAPQDRPS